MIEKELGSLPGRPEAEAPVIFIGVPMAVGVRDILRSQVLEVLRQAGVHLHLFTRAAHVRCFVDELSGPGVRVHPLRPAPTGPFRFVDGIILRLYLVLLSCRTETGRIKVQARLKRSPWVRMLHRITCALEPRFGAAMVRLTQWIIQRFGPDLYGDAILDLRPDLVIGTRVLTMITTHGKAADPYLDRYLAISAKKHRIPSMVLIPSWDNLTSKGFFSVQPDQITVWNDTMRREAVELHGLPGDAVIVTGAPQHDVYAHTPFADRPAFCRGLGLDPEKPFLVYATQTEGTVPGEPDLVLQIYHALRQRFGESVQFIVRVHQLDRAGRHEPLRGLPGVMVDTAGAGYLGDYPDRVFDRAAMEHLADTLHHAAVVASTASSISIDAAAVGTPVIGVHFDAARDCPRDRSVRRFYAFTHQANLVRSGGLRLVSSMDELVGAVARYLKDPALDAVARGRMVEEQCYRVDGDSGRRVANAILDTLLAALGAPQHRER